MKTTHEQTTLITAAMPGELSQLEAAIMDACNELHEARAMGDAERAGEIRTRLFAIIDRYDETDGDDHPNPAWARPNQRALAFSAAGELDEAIRTERLALKYADTPRRREISLDNLADRCLRAGLYDESVMYFLQAYEVAPSSVPVLLTGAQALYLSGHMSEADAIFAALLDQPEQLSACGALGAYLDHEPRLREMAEDLPALAALFDAWECTVGGRFGAGEGGAA